MISPEDEGDLVERAKHGSKEAFSALVERHQGAVRAFLRRLCGNWAEADDLAQDVFVTAWLQLGRFRSGETMRAWLCGIAYRKFLTRRRSIVRRLRREGLSVEPMEHSTSPGMLSDARLDLVKAMAKLSDEQRAAVALCLAADFSHAEAAEALGLPLGTVKSHVQRGREKLSALLGGERE